MCVSVYKKYIMSDTCTLAGKIAGPVGYAIACNFAAVQGFGSDEPTISKIWKDVSSTAKTAVKSVTGGEFAAVDDAAGDAVDALEEAGTGADLVEEKGTATKSYSMFDWLVFALTIVAIITSWTLNNDKNVRIKLGYDNDGLSAGIVVSLLSIVAIFMFGPWLYFLFLLAPLFQFLPFLDTVNKRYWIEGVKDAFNDVNVPSRDKTILRYIAMLPQGMQSGVPVSTKVVASPAQFGHFYY
jgi:hypothetical protein